MSTERDKLQGWKEIASFLGRDERTAKRWEKQRGLPVRRIPGAGRANVYGLIAEFEEWLAAGPGPAALAESATASEEAQQAEEPGVAEEVGVPVEPVASPPAPRSRWGLWLGGSLAALVMLVAGVRAAKGFHGSGAVPTVPTLTAPAARARGVGYRSAKAGVDQLYLQGVYFYEQRTPASLENARKIFSDVIALDDRDAPAYAGLAETYLLQREYAAMVPAEAYLRARAAAERALQLEPSLSEAHAVLGFIDFFSGFDPRAATEEFKTALALDPDCVLAHHWYGSMLTHRGLYAQGLEELTIAERLEPRSAAVISSRAFALGLGGQRAEALQILNRMIEMDPGEPSPPRIVARLALQPPREMEQYFKGLLEFEGVRHNAEERRAVEADQAAYRSGGEEKMWAGVLAREKMKNFSAAKPSYAMAEAEAQLGHRAEALAMLTVMAEHRDMTLIGLRINPLFAEIRGEPGFQKILNDLGLNGVVADVH